MLVVVVIGVVALSAPAALALRLAGFRAQGRTVDYLNEQAAVTKPTIQWPAAQSAVTFSTPTPAGTPEPVVQPQGTVPAEPLDSVQVDIWFLSQPAIFYPHQIFAKRLERGRTDDHQLAYYIEFNQEGVNTYLNYWFGDFVEQEARVRNVWIDLKPGGAVAYAEVNLELGWQRVGAVLMLDASGRQFVLAGVEIEGQLYSTPPAGQIADLAGQLEREGNRALRELTFLDPAGQLCIQAISLGEDGVQILAY